MRTGTDNIDFLGIMDAWNYEQYPPYYDGECARITGTTGELFPPMENVNKVGLFASEICGSLELVKSDDPFTRLGLEAYK
jgi:hypothetical protein